jgi:hypothetical protein
LRGIGLIEKLFKKVGNNNDTYFWLDPLLEGERLCDRFSRLFKVVVEKYVRGDKYALLE